MDLITPMNELFEVQSTNAILPHQINSYAEKCLSQLRTSFISSSDFRKAKLFPHFSIFARKTSERGTWRPAKGYVFKLQKACSLSVLHDELKKLAECLEQSLSERFTNSSLLQNFRIFVPGMYLGLPSLDEFGKEELRNLLKYFCGSYIEDPKKRSFNVV